MASTKVVVALAGSKTPGASDCLQRAQGLAHAGPQRQRARGGLHAGTAAAHQLVAKRLAQAPQRVAHGGLGQREVARGPGQAALGHDLVEHAQQVQVKGAEIGRKCGA
jgi:hypothetical protein